jgi:hypothetical protein
MYFFQCFESELGSGFKGFMYPYPNPHSDSRSGSGSRVFKKDLKCDTTTTIFDKKFTQTAESASTVMSTIGLCSVIDTREAAYAVS